MTSPVDWQINKKELKQRGQYILETGLWSDCSFVVGVEPHQQIFNGHKLFLAMSSPVFEAMFFGTIAEKNDQPIPILDVQPEAFRALLEYIYTDKINLHSFDQACELCYGAKKYMLPHLVEECTNYLWSDLFPTNACRAYEFAKLFEEPILMDKCLEIIRRQTMDVLNDNSFEDVEIDTLLTIYSQEYLAIDSELDLFNAIARYAAKNGNNTGVSPKKPRIECNVNNSSETSKNTEKHGATSNDIVPTIRDVIKKIRFLTMTPQQFADGPALSELLTKSEKFDIFMNISSQMSQTPMPDGFTTLRKDRKRELSYPDRDQQFTVSRFNNNNDTIGQRRGLSSSTTASNNNNSGSSTAVRSASKITPFSVEECASIELLPSGEEMVRNMPKYYCTRTLVQQTDCLNNSAIECSLTFSVDRNICILGIQVPSQILRFISDASDPSESSIQSGMYSELLYAHLVDAEGSRLTYLHYTARVNYRSIIELMFYRPVYIQRNKEYRVGVVFNRNGWYRIGQCTPVTTVASVTFTFSNETVRDGLIRSIIFSY